MNDVTGYRLNFRGYPVTVVSDGVAALLAESSHGAACDLSWVLRKAADTAEPGEPSGWYFSSDIDGHAVMIERFGGVRDDTGHHDGQWSVYLPEER
jgi:hypothetical protein